MRKVAEMPTMPTRSRINTWLAAYPEFADQYARACQIRREDRYDQMEEIVDSIEDKIGYQKARLKIDVIKWQLGKEEPKKYGDKLMLDGKQEHSGSVDVNHAYAELSDDELLNRAKAAIANAKKGLGDGK